MDQSDHSVGVEYSTPDTGYVRWVHRLRILVVAIVADMVLFLHKKQPLLLLI